MTTDQMLDVCLDAAAAFPTFATGRESDRKALRAASVSRARLIELMERRRLAKESPRMADHA